MLDRFDYESISADANSGILRQQLTYEASCWTVLTTRLITGVANFREAAVSDLQLNKCLGFCTSSLLVCCLPKANNPQSFSSNKPDLAFTGTSCLAKHLSDLFDGGKRIISFLSTTPVFTS